VWGVQKVSEDWHCRRGILKKRYVYRISETLRSAFNSDTFWTIPYSLHLEKMQLAAQLLSGTHDFSAFKSAHGMAMSDPIKEMDVQIKSDFLEFPFNYHCKTKCYQFVFESRSFLYHQVRNMVGCLVLIGRESMNLSQLKEMLETKVKPSISILVPPHGLFLADIIYQDEVGTIN